MSRMDYIIIFSTFPDSDTARTVSQKLLETKVVACASIIENIVSHFWWQGAIDNAREVLLIAKTEKSYFDRVESLIKNNHSYEVPEIIALPIVAGHAPYLDWISQSVNNG